LHVLNKSEADGLRREQSDDAVVAPRIVPGEKDMAGRAAVLDAAESIGKVRPVLERLERA